MLTGNVPGIGTIIACSKAPHILQGNVIYSSHSIPRILNGKVDLLLSLTQYSKVNRFRFTWTGQSNAVHRCNQLWVGFCVGSQQWERKLLVCKQARWLVSVAVHICRSCFLFAYSSESNQFRITIIVYILPHWNCWYSSVWESVNLQLWWQCPYAAPIIHGKCKHAISHPVSMCINCVVHQSQPWFLECEFLQLWLCCS